MILSRLFINIRLTHFHIIILILYVSTTVFITQGNYVGYMFRILNSHLQAYSLQVKSQDAVHTLGSQCVYISELLKPYHLRRRVKRSKCVTNWLKCMVIKTAAIFYYTR
jgi:hypothetical protein